MLLLIASCATQRAPQPGEDVVKPAPKPGEPPPPVAVEPPLKPRIDPLADVAGDKPAPLAPQGALERIDCTSGEEFLHARMSFEARGGQVTHFAYYSIWKPRTCAFDFARTTKGVKWRLTPDGATRVHTPQGRFLIRATPDAYVFEFEQVERRKFCGMSGDINGSMTIQRKANPPQCDVVGILDTNDAVLDALKQAK
jgi:hypothetical protein